MLEMHGFYAWLCQAPEMPDPVRESLADLTHARPAQMGALQSDLEWGSWPAEAA